MVKIADLTGHTSRVIFMAHSPDGCAVASAAGDATLRFRFAFGTPELAKPATPELAKPATKTHSHVGIASNEKM
ncbi:hypothetical protein C5167_035510 [Papaver somniferum]|uniref:Anaphase-promoting complex subunit 4 WD40 domain-containing protein n=1 Tax=Papaver somniferum TaxID=3469 RepID=A0A4Y7KK54_PAPSO|nr:hypothetical protein C5167_035510 [Papaver somniferum]